MKNNLNSKIKIPKTIKYNIHSLQREIKCFLKLFDLIRVKKLNNSIISGILSLMLIVNIISISIFTFNYYLYNEEATLKTTKLTNNDSCFLYCGATEYCIFDQTNYINNECNLRYDSEIILYQEDIFEIFKDDCTWNIVLVNKDDIELKLETLGYINNYEKNKLLDNDNLGVIENNSTTNYANIKKINETFINNVNINYFANLEYLKLQFISFTKNKDLTSNIDSTHKKETWSISTWKIYEKYEKCKNYLGDDEDNLTCGAFQINFNDNIFIINFDTLIEIIKSLIIIYFSMKFYLNSSKFIIDMIWFQRLIKHNLRYMGIKNNNDNVKLDDNDKLNGIIKLEDIILN